MIWAAIAIVAVIGLVLLFRSKEDAAPEAKPETKKPAPKAKAAPAAKASASTVVDDENEDDAVEITLVRAVPLELLEVADSQRKPNTPVEPPVLERVEDPEEGDDVVVERSSTTTPFYPEDEPDAAVDEPTQPATRFLISACGQSDQGLARKRNEDSYLLANEKGIFVVADGMGGYAGGKVASELAVATLHEIFDKESFSQPLDTTVPRRGAEIAQAVQKANTAIFARAQTDAQLAQMGTTIVAARFSPNKQRAYIAHVGDSRAYRFRGGAMRRLTTDHTMKQLGYKGKGSEHLYRAVGIAATVDVDLIIDRPRPDDVYLFCSDGLTKMATDMEIATVIRDNIDDAEAIAYSLIEIANDHGGKDNVTCVIVKVVERVPEVLAKAHQRRLDASS